MRLPSASLTAAICLPAHILDVGVHFGARVDQRLQGAPDVIDVVKTGRAEHGLGTSQVGGTVDD
jgi:hypothetical protein